MEISLQLQQKQILSLKQQKSVEILQMNTLALYEYARELAEDNPLIEWNEEDGVQENLLQKLEWLEEDDMENRSLYRVEYESDEQEAARFGRKEGESLREYLLFQINTKKIPEGHKIVLRFLAESTAENGYLEADAIDMMVERYPMKESTAMRILAEFQSLDPVGVGARNLKECLLIQLKAKGASHLSVLLAENYLEELAKNRLSYIAKQMKVAVGEVNEALQEIRSCQPNPGSGFSGEGQTEYVIPDILVEHIDDALVVTVNSGVVPHLNISHSYIRMLRSGTAAETEQYISEKLKQAEWALQCISRRESTLRQVAECIVRRQHIFFAEPHGQLVPLRMADVAEELGIHESTVSRAVKGKYLQCERGIFLLDAFFSQAMAAAEGAVSADSIKEKLKGIIAAEDKKKPLSDRELTEKLVDEGIQISRRTVAKYREAMEIPGAAGRKSF